MPAAAEGNSTVAWQYLSALLHCLEDLCAQPEGQDCQNQQGICAAVSPRLHYLFYTSLILQLQLTDKT